MALILHITDRSSWQAAQTAGVYRHASLETEGFIHCSTPAQLIGVANTFFRGQRGLVLLCIESERLQSELRYDAVGNQHFPHVYGEINLDAVEQVRDFDPNATGEFEPPPE
ncbi:MAG: DUF952 domain-containing protein [Cyanobacteria bacterium RM1_2_2]|nr:DUF952 domain-containing protein [Cyanobacteria bacterium RM1_2_2]